MSSGSVQNLPNAQLLRLSPEVPSSHPHHPGKEVRTTPLSAGMRSGRRTAMEGTSTRRMLLSATATVLPCDGEPNQWVRIQDLATTSERSIFPGIRQDARTSCNSTASHNGKKPAMAGRAAAAIEMTAMAIF